MGFLFKVASREIFSLSTLFLLVIPMLISMNHGGSAKDVLPEAVQNISIPSVSALENGFEVSLRSVIHSGLRTVSGGAPSLYLGNGRPIFLPQ